MFAFALLPPLVRLYIRSVITGVWLGVVFVALLLAADVGGLRRLVLAAPEGGLAVAMLVVFNAFVFGAAQFGIRVMALARQDGGRGGGGALTKHDRHPPTRPVRVKIAVPDRR